MKSRELEKMLAGLTGWTLSEIDQRMRPLRAEGLPAFASTARGLHAPDIAPIHAAMMLLQLVSRRAVDAGQVGRTARQLCSVSEAIGTQIGPKGTSLTLFLTILLTNGAPLQPTRIEATPDGKNAWLDFYSESDRCEGRFWFSNTHEPCDGAIEHRLVIGGDALAKIRAAVSDPIADSAFFAMMTDAVNQQIALDGVAHFRGGK